MTRLTAEQIAHACDDLDGLANIRAINKMFRDQDESHLWPINNRFNATERAIRHARAFMRDAGPMAGYEYAAFLDADLSRIVNGVV